MPPTEETAAVENKSVVVNVSHRQSSLLLFKALTEVDNVIETDSKVSYFFLSLWRVQCIRLFKIALTPFSLKRNRLKTFAHQRVTTN